MKKRCPRCGIAKDKCDFRKSNRRSDGLQSWCKSCHSEFEKTKYANSKKERDRIRRNYKNQVRRNKERIREYLKSNPCVDCGEKEILFLQFDHLRDKKDAVTTMVRKGNSWEKILKEIEKCDVVCAHCHIRRTAVRCGSHRLELGNEV